ncbi:MAG TPA: hypothetical protein VJA22_03515, partial [Patescibacteria group bacterium]|nr:hypothetical protein [Patescibacteria group bacterium]
MSEEDISQRQVSNLAYQACSGCQGFGRQQKSFCSLCNGVGLIKPFPYGEGSARKIFYLYWGARVDRLSIYQDRLRRHFRMGLNIACVLLAVSGVLVLFSPIISQLRLENPVDFSVIGENLIMGNGGSLFFFWFTMVTNLYFIFTWQRSHEKMRLVLPKLYDRFDKNARSSQQHEVLSVSWDAIAQISKEEKINVADVYTEEALKYIQKSWQFAKKLNTPHVEPIHLFGMMLESKRSAYIFGRLGIKISDIADKLRKHLFQDTENMLGTGFSLDLKKLFIDAYLEAYQDKQDKVDVDELLIGIAQFHDNIVNEVLYEFDVTEQKLRNVATWLRVNDILSGRVSRFRKKAALRSKSGMDRAMTAIATPFLNQFSTDMTLQAKFGHLQPLVGRERE